VCYGLQAGFWIRGQSIGIVAYSARSRCSRTGAPLALLAQVRSLAGKSDDFGPGVSLGAFFVREVRSEDPILPLDLFRKGNFVGANLETLLVYAAMGGSCFFLVLYPQTVSRAPFLRPRS
jgi:hypothetical protein